MIVRVDCIMYISIVMKLSDMLSSLFEAARVPLKKKNLKAKKRGRFA